MHFAVLLLSGTPRTSSGRGGNCNTDWSSVSQIRYYWHWSWFLENRNGFVL